MSEVKPFQTIHHRDTKLTEVKKKYIYSPLSRSRVGCVLNSDKKQTSVSGVIGSPSGSPVYHRR